jgi:hypothetical protein
MKKSAWFVAAPLTAFLIVAPAFRVPVALANGSAKHKITLSGANAVPAGDPDGSGTATVEIRAKDSKVCWKISTDKIEKPTAAHIHSGAVGVSGPPVVPLTPVDKGCATAAAEVVKGLLDNPDQYYVNVHTQDYPDGAIRGQLAEKKK